MGFRGIIGIMLGLAACGRAAQGQAITTAALLEEMADPQAAARFPAVPYRQLEASSYNRASVSPLQKDWFADSDGLGYIREETHAGRKEYVIMEQDGPGCITRMWTPYFYYRLDDHAGPNIRIYLDGQAVPAIQENFIGLLTGRSFVRPPLANLTTRAGVCYLPIPFRSHCKITLDKPPFYYCINYRVYPPQTPVVSFSRERFTAPGSTAWAGKKWSSAPMGGRAVSRAVFLRPGDSLQWTLAAGTRLLRRLQMTLQDGNGATALGRVLLRMRFDGEQTVCCPLGDFFCAADTLHRVRTLHIKVEGDTLLCAWPMPYRRSASMTLVNFSGETLSLALEAVTAPWRWDERSMYFHAGWCDYGLLPGDRFFDLNFVHLRGKGVLAGDALTVLSPGTGWWGEGDEKIYTRAADLQRRFPSHFGTGTEDYYGWAGGVVPTGKDTFSIPFGANVSVGNAKNPRGFNICLRDRVLDAIPFDDELRFDMEASPGVDIRHGYNLLAYSMVTYWYGLPGAVSNRDTCGDALGRPRLRLQEVDTLEQKLRAGTAVLDTVEMKARIRTLSGIFP